MYHRDKPFAKPGLWALVILVVFGVGLIVPSCGAPQRQQDEEVHKKRVVPAGQRFEGWVLPRLETGKATSGQDDLNSNGEMDCWRILPSAGGGYSGVTLTARPGCAGAVLTLETVGRRNALVNFIPLSLSWQRSARFTLGVLAMLFGEEAIRLPYTIKGTGIPVTDSFGAWVLESFERDAERAAGRKGRQRRQPLALSRQTPFTERGRFTVNWTPGKPDVPETQVIMMTHRTEMLQRHLLRSTPRRQPGTWGLTLLENALHGRPESVGTCGRWDVLSTGHALAIEHGETDSFAWVYIAKEASRRNAPTLRQPVCYRDVIIVESAPDPVSRKLLFIAPDIGRYGSIPLKPDDQWGLRRGSEQISIGGVTYSNDALLERINAGR